VKKPINYVAGPCRHLMSDLLAGLPSLFTMIACMPKTTPTLAKRIVSRTQSSEFGRTNKTDKRRRHCVFRMECFITLLV